MVKKTNRIYSVQVLDKRKNKQTKTTTKTAKDGKDGKDGKHGKNNIIINVLSTVKNYYNSVQNNIRINVYARAIYQLKHWPYKITSGDDVKHLVGIGKGIVEKINTILKTGTLPLIKEKKLSIVNNSNDGGDGGDHSNSTGDGKHLNNLTNILGFGEKFVAKLKNDFAINTIADLEKYIQSHKNNSKISLNLQQYIGLKWNTDLAQPIPRNEALAFYNKLLIAPSLITLINKYKLIFKLAGSFPSGKKSSKDIDILIATPKNTYIAKEHVLHKVIKSIGNMQQCQDNTDNTDNTNTIGNKAPVIELSCGNTKFLGLMLSQAHTQTNKCIYHHVDMRLVTYEAYPFARLYFCSGKQFNIILRSILKKKGYKLNEWGLFYEDSSSTVDLDLQDGKDIFRENKKTNNNSLSLTYEALEHYADRIEKKIFSLAEMDYKTYAERY